MYICELYVRQARIVNHCRCVRLFSLQMTCALLLGLRNVYIYLARIHVFGYAGHHGRYIAVVFLSARLLLANKVLAVLLYRYRHNIKALCNGKRHQVFAT